MIMSRYKQVIRERPKNKNNGSTGLNIQRNAPSPIAEETETSIVFPGICTSKLLLVLIINKLRSKNWLRINAKTKPNNPIYDVRMNDNKMKIDIPITLAITRIRGFSLAKTTC